MPLSKAEEAAQETSNSEQLSGGPPAYDVHEYDEVYTTNDAAQAHEAYLSSIGVPLPEAHSPAGPSEQVALERPLTEPLSLTMDDDLIYPTLPPSTALYHIPRRLTWPGERVMLKRSVPEKRRKNGSLVPVEDQELYELASNGSIVELVPKRASCYGKGTAVMKTAGIFQPNCWEVLFQRDVVLRFRKGEWMGGDGKVLAVEEKMEKGKGKSAYKERRVIVVRPGVDQKMLNLLVAAWTAKVWRGLAQSLSTETSRVRYGSR